MGKCDLQNSGGIEKRISEKECWARKTLGVTSVHHYAYPVCWFLNKDACFISKFMLNFGP